MLDKRFIELYAKNIEKEINHSIKMSMEGVSRSIREFAYNIIAREAPELDEKERGILLDEWIPQLNGSSNSLVKNGCVNGVPSSMMFEMVYQFVEYGVGKMLQEEVKALEESVGISWCKRYWDIFPTQIKRLIREFIKGEISFEVFNEKLKSLLGEL